MTAPLATSIREETAALLKRLGVAAGAFEGGGRLVTSPITGEIIAEVHDRSARDVAGAIDAAHAVPQPVSV